MYSVCSVVFAFALVSSVDRLQFLLVESFRLFLHRFFDLLNHKTVAVGWRQLLIVGDGRDYAGRDDAGRVGWVHVVVNRVVVRGRDADWLRRELGGKGATGRNRERGRGRRRKTLVQQGCRRTH